MKDSDQMIIVLITGIVLSVIFMILTPIRREIYRSQEYSEYFTKTHNKLKSLKPNDQAVIGRTIYKLIDSKIMKNSETYNFSNGTESVSVIVENNTMTIMSLDKKCGYMVDVENNRYKKIPNDEKWKKISDNESENLLKDIFKEELLEKCNTINF
jgi:hypothetical protein